MSGFACTKRIQHTEEVPAPRRGGSILRVFSDKVRAYERLASTPSGVGTPRTRERELPASTIRGYLVGGRLYLQVLHPQPLSHGRPPMVQGFAPSSPIAHILI